MMRKYPAIAPLSFLIAGILTADYFALPSWTGLILSAFALVAGLIFLRVKLLLAPIFLLIAIGGFGATHFSARFIDNGPQHISQFTNPKTVTRIYGRVADWPDLKANRTEIVISVDSLVDEYRQAVVGKILLKVSDTTTELQRGDRVEFSGRLYPLPDNGGAKGFDYGRFLRLKEISAIVYLPTLLNVRVDHLGAYALFPWIDKLRSSLLSVFQQTLSPRGAALSAGFLIGETRNIPPDIYRMFRDSGTMHLLAVSGSNVALVIIFAMVLLRPFRFRGKWQAIILLGVIVIFVMLSYGEPSVVRAAIMAGLVIVARLFGRKIDLNHIISLTALIILLVNPAQLFDVGFQLSFVTAWGLIFIVPKLVEPFRRWHSRVWYKWLLFPVIISVVAQVVSTPIVAVYFHRIPVISVLANLVIVPLVSLAVLAILAVLVAYFVLPVLGLFVGSLVNLLLELIIRVLISLGGEQLPVISTAGMSGHFGAGWVVLFFYVIVILVAISVRHKVARRLTLFAILSLITVGLVADSAFAERTNDTNIFLRKIPGGIVALVARDGDSRADMLITGLGRRDYSLGEKVLTPMIAETGISRIRSLFLLSADYSSLKDLLTFCRRQNVERLYLPERLRAVLKDIRAGNENNFATVLTGFMGSANAPQDNPINTGWLATSDSVVLTVESSSILFVNSIDSFNESPAETVSRLKRVVVLGSRWSPTPAEVSRFRQIGIELFIALRIRGFFGDAMNNPDIDSDSDTDAGLPDYLIDLSQRRELSLILSSEGKILLK